MKAFIKVLIYGLTIVWLAEFIFFALVWIVARTEEKYRKDEERMKELFRPYHESKSQDKI